VPDRGVVRALREIDKDLSVSFDPNAGTPPVGRWIIWYKLDLPGRVDETVDRLAREVQLRAAEEGRTLDLADCQADAWEAIQKSRLVCFVTNEDGSYRPLDGRIVEKVKKMDYLRRHCGVEDWKTMLNARAAAAEAVRQKDHESMYDSIRRDRVLQRVLSDVLWGLKPTRSVCLQGIHFRGGKAA